MAALKTTPRTRRLVAVCLMTFLWTLAIASLIAGTVSGNGSWYIVAAVFFVNGFVPVPFFRYFRAMEAGPNAASTTLIGRVPVRTKRTLLVGGVVFCMTVAAVLAYSGWLTSDNGRYLTALVFFANGLVLLQVIRETRALEAQATE